MFNPFPQARPKPQFNVGKNNAVFEPEETFTELLTASEGLLTVTESQYAVL
jgi:hypothetical protein